MSEHVEHAPSAAPAAHGSGDGHGHAGDDEKAHARKYIKIWLILLGLLVVSVVGPMFEIQALTLVTAFGIAIVKAALVVRNFMHLNLEKKWVGYMLAAMLLFVSVFLGGTASDIQSHEGQNWENRAAKESVKRGLEAGAAHGAEHPAQPAAPH